MKTILLILLAMTAQPAWADQDSKAQDLGYAGAKYIMEDACEEAQLYRESEGPCKALIARMNSGHLVRQNDYDSWCGMTKASTAKLVKFEQDYKKVYGKALNYKECSK